MRKKVLILMVAFIILSFSVASYKMEPGSSATHQKITKEAVKVWPSMPYESKKHTNNSIDGSLDPFSLANFDEGDDVITGSGEEDRSIGTTVHLFGDHFWDVDNPNTLSMRGIDDYNDGLLIFGSSYRKALRFWREKVIKNYIKGNEDEAYYYLGRVAHLLEDAAQPSHVHNDPHPPGTPEYSLLEDYAGEPSYYNSLDGELYLGQQYNYDSLLENFNWEEVQPSRTPDRRYLEFFRLFWYTAQKTQYWASDDSNGNTFYVKLDGTSSNWQCNGVGDLNLWADEGYTSCSDFISQSNNLNINTVSQEANAVVPHAMKAVAGLYRLFDDAVRIDYPTENHDYRRTGFTLLKGDMNRAQDIERTAFLLDSNVGQEQVVKPLVADINGDGNMDTVSFLHNMHNNNRTKIFGVEVNSRGRSRKQWEVITQGGAIYFPGTLANIDNDKQKELITGTRDGRIYAYDISSNGRTITQRWVTQLPARNSPLAGLSIVAFNGGNAVVDIDLDGNNEIILADVAPNGDESWPGRLYVLQDNGPGRVPTVEGQLTLGNGGAYATISVANVDNDDNPEIIVPTLYGIKVVDYDSTLSNKLRVKWQNSHGKIESSAVVADVDRDNEYELIYSTSDWVCRRSCDNRTLIVDANTGSIERQISMNAVLRPTPSVGNLDNDPELEVVFISQDNVQLGDQPSKGDVHCYNINGQKCSGSWPFNLNNNLRTPFMSPNIADVNGDENNDVIFAENEGNRLFVLNDDGTELFHYQFEGFVDNGIAVADVDNDQVAEIALKRAGSPVTLFSIVSAMNDKPHIEKIPTKRAIAGELVSVQATATDPNEQNLRYYFSAPFNDSGVWQTTQNDTGVYEILAEVTDGNLTDSTFFPVTVYNQSVQRIDTFADGSSQQVLQHDASSTRVFAVKVPKNATIIHASLQITGGSQ